MGTEYVSRGGKKLEHALKVFDFSPKDLICADFGSSTGGFVDCLLSHAAKRVYAVETGYGVVDWKLRNDLRVVLMEKTNAMHVVLSEKVSFISIDTSWTKLEKIIPNALQNLAKGGRIIALVKPHYEAQKDMPRNMIRKGKLLDEFIPQIMEQVKGNLIELGLKILGETESPITGGKAKNREFLLYLKAQS